MSADRVKAGFSVALSPHNPEMRPHLHHEGTRHAQSSRDRQWHPKRQSSAV